MCLIYRNRIYYTYTENNYINLSAYLGLEKDIYIYTSTDEFYQFTMENFGSMEFKYTVPELLVVPVQSQYHH
jgi:hypothetical protein